MTKKYTDYTTEFATLGYSFKLNLMNDSIECNGQRMTDVKQAIIESKMFDRGYQSVAGIRRSIARNAAENSYHPLQKWMNGLQWNGQDHFGEMIQHFKFEHQKISEIFMWRFLVGCVGKVMSDGQEQNFMLVLDGLQGVGKSYWANWLVSKEIRKYFVEGGLDPDHKDTKIRVVSNFLWEVGELQGTTKKADLESLKNIITQKRMTVRLPYGHFDIDKPITCSFIGTVNENGAGFLNDVTGNRRFAIIKVTNLEWDYTKMSQDDLWSQVVAAYKAGERGELTPQEKAEQATINTEYDTISHVEQFLLAHYDIDTVAYSGKWTPINEIIYLLEENGLSRSNQRLNLMELATVLSKWGCGKSRSNPVTGCGRTTCYNGLREKSMQNANIFAPP